MNYNEIYNNLIKLCNDFNIKKGCSVNRRTNRTDYYLFRKRLNVIIVELLDLEKESILSLNKTSTYILRYYLGIYKYKYKVYNNYNFKDLGLNLLDKDVQLIVRNALNSLFSDYMDKNNNLVKCPVSALMISDKYEELKDLPVGRLFLNSATRKNLSNFRNLYDLLSYTLSDLKRITTDYKVYSDIVKFVHALGLKFYDELSFDEKREILKKCDLKDLGNLSIRYLNTYKLIDVTEIKSCNIGTLVEYINIYDINLNIEVLKELMDLGFEISSDNFVKHHIVGKEDVLERVSIIDSMHLPMQVLINLSSKYVGLSNKSIAANYSFKKIKDIIILTNEEFLQVKCIDDETKDKIINAIHNLGLYFKDEALLLDKYSCLMYEELKGYKTR